VYKLLEKWFWLQILDSSAINISRSTQYMKICSLHIATQLGRLAMVWLPIHRSGGWRERDWDQQL